ncbi:hypothetical protein [Micromonospora sp. WMMD714]|uniref:hypothetical protein n=1 Tax=Micromonospora sp. WMMD714 TaxID=3016097 RepID=UPI00249C7F25|nr:hypothetical protein [Micromonospora sp. WMMD714]WFE62726.1 hypothetical protein O7625_05215 [Micromonospora sp. WMMD714]
MVDPTALLADLTDESEQLDTLVAAFHAPVSSTTAPGRLVEDEAAGFLAPPRVAGARRADREGAAA